MRLDEFREAVCIHWFKDTFLLLSPSCHDGKSPAAMSTKSLTGLPWPPPRRRRGEWLVAQPLAGLCNGNINMHC